MGMFTMRKPRGFNHSYIYVDERKEKLAKMEEDAKRELGMLPEKAPPICSVVKRAGASLCIWG